MKTFNIDSRDHYKTKVFPSPFHARQAERNENREWSRWYDYLSVPAYTCSTLEYFAGRNSCGVFDITPMTKHRITGPDALPFLDRLVTRDVSKIKPGRVGYAVWCDDQGQVIDDGTIFHLAEGDYRLCSQEHQLDWLLINARGFDVTIVEDTHDVAGLALQGPTSFAVLERLGLPGIEELTPFGLRYFDFEGGQLLVSRTGYTGDLGYELWIDPEHAEALWDRLFEAGELLGIRPMGRAARARVTSVTATAETLISSSSRGRSNSAVCGVMLELWPMAGPSDMMMITVPMPLIQPEMTGYGIRLM